MSPEGLNSLLLMLLAFAVWGALWFVAWLVMWRKQSQNWPIWVALVPVALVAAFGVVAVAPLVITLPLVLGVITTIGLVKLAVAGVGRRNVFANSKMHAAQPKAPPRGLVESRSDEDA